MTRGFNQSQARRYAIQVETIPADTPFLFVFYSAGNGNQKNTATSSSKPPAPGKLWTSSPYFEGGPPEWFRTPTRRLEILGPGTTGRPRQGEREGKQGPRASRRNERWFFYAYLIHVELGNNDVSWTLVSSASKKSQDGK